MEIQCGIPTFSYSLVYRYETSLLIEILILTLHFHQKINIESFSFETGLLFINFLQIYAHIGINLQLIVEFKLVLTVHYMLRELNYI